MRTCSARRQATSIRLADTSLIIEVEKDFTTYGEEVKFGGGKVIRDGMGQSAGDARGGRGRYGHHQCGHSRPLGHREGRYRHQERPDRRHRQGRQSGCAAECRHHHRARHGDHRRRRQDHHRRRLRLAYPLHLPAADRRGADVGHHHHAGRRNGTRDRHLRHHLHAGAMAYRAHDRGGGCISDEPRLHRQGQCLEARRARGDDPGRRLRAEAARGLGHDARCHRLLPVGCGCLRRAGDDPHRYAQRIRLRRGYDRGLQGPHDPRLPHGRRGRRPRAGHHQGRGASQRAAVLHQPDPALYGEHHRRASRHAHGLPPPRSRRSRRISPSPRAASARRPSRRRTSCTISARSR